MAAPMHDDEVAIDATIVRRLIDSQMSQLSAMPLEVVEPWGTDNAIWRLGDDLVVRFPRIHWAASQVDREAKWLPKIAPHLSIDVPEPVAVGEADFGYPFRWAVHKWIPGNGAALHGVDDPVGFALDIARVIVELRAAPTHDAPRPRTRARRLIDYDTETRYAIRKAKHLIDAEAALAIWDEALAAAPYNGPAAWVHGDLEGNCLLRNRRLCGIVDWGSACVGDPAVDVQVIWSPLFNEQSRREFLDHLEVDNATLARSRGAAVNQACAALPYYLHTYPLIVERSWHKLAALGVPRAVD